MAPSMQSIFFHSIYSDEHCSLNKLDMFHNLLRLNFSLALYKSWAKILNSYREIYVQRKQVSKTENEAQGCECDAKRIFWNFWIDFGGFGGNMETVICRKIGVEYGN